MGSSCNGVFKVLVLKDGPVGTPVNERRDARNLSVVGEINKDRYSIPTAAERVEIDMNRGGQISLTY